MYSHWPLPQPGVRIEWLMFVMMQDGLARKEFRFLGYNIDMSSLETRCTGGHPHVRIEAQYTKKSIVYTPELAAFLARHVAAAVAKLRISESKAP